MLPGININLKPTCAKLLASAQKVAGMLPQIV